MPGWVISMSFPIIGRKETRSMTSKHICETCMRI